MKGKANGKQAVLKAASPRRVFRAENGEIISQGEIRFAAAMDHPKGLLFPRPAYATTLGAMYAIDAVKAMEFLPEESINLVVTSPPYALHFKKEYGNADKEAYVAWFRPFARQVFRILKPDGSFILNIGGSYNAGLPTRSLYHFRLLLMLCDEVGFHLAQECFWYNPAKLPSPAEWVNVRRIRIKDSVEYVWWLSKTPNPKADNRKVLVEYSSDMVRLLNRGYRAKERPSGHKITEKFRNRGGSIPSNVLRRGNNESNSDYIRLCEECGIKPHPARLRSEHVRFSVRDPARLSRRQARVEGRQSGSLDPEFLCKEQPCPREAPVSQFSSSSPGSPPRRSRRGSRR